ncbi:MAG: phosphatase PAP2 family protein [Acidobacteria bacterium]|nr:phosphatase PAP2 family protein [Acidobacteriota bacterium]
MRLEPAAIGTVFVLALALLVFGALANQALDGDPLAVDRAVLLAMRDEAGRPIGPAWLEGAARDVTSLGSNAVLALASVAAIGFLLLSGARSAAMLVVASVGSGYGLMLLLKNAIGRARPDLVPHAVQVVSAGFPSGHAMLSAVTYLTLGALLARVQPRRWLKGYVLGMAVVLTLLVGLSRVYLGVHWPTDVVAGWCLGAGWALAWWRAAVWLHVGGAWSRFHINIGQKSGGP